MKKIFWKWTGKGATGKELMEDKFGLTRDEDGILQDPTPGNPWWIRFEREVFTANGFEWFRHNTGDQMPCIGDAEVMVITENDLESAVNFPAIPARLLDWSKDPSAIIGWRYIEPKWIIQDKGPLEIVPGCTATCLHKNAMFEECTVMQWVEKGDPLPYQTKGQTAEDAGWVVMFGDGSAGRYEPKLLYRLGRPLRPVGYAPIPITRSQYSWEDLNK